MNKFGAIINLSERYWNDLKEGSMEKKLLYSPREFLESGLFPGGRATLYNLLHRSDFPKIRVGHKFFIPLDGYLRWIEEQSKPAAR